MEAANLPKLASSELYLAFFSGWKPIALAEQWWTAKEDLQVFPDVAASRQFLAWLRQFSLGRKRLLDALMASTYHQVSVDTMLTTNPGDFAVFGVFRCVTPSAAPTP